MITVVVQQDVLIDGTLREDIRVNRANFHSHPKEIVLGSRYQATWSPVVTSSGLGVGALEETALPLKSLHSWVQSCRCSCVSECMCVCAIYVQVWVLSTLTHLQRNGKCSS